jgi:hypothetical protein
VVQELNDQQEDSNLNLDEEVKRAMQDNKVLKVVRPNFLIPPPEDLIKKTFWENEPIQTGAPIPFM